MTLANFQGQKFFKHAATCGLTGEQLRVLCFMMSREADGSITVFQKGIADALGLAESNVSRSIKALIEAGLIQRRPGELWDGSQRKYVEGVYFEVPRKWDIKNSKV